MQFVLSVLNKKKERKIMTDLDLILCEYQTKFGELLKIANQISDDSNPAHLKKLVDEFKEKWNIDELYI